jgi:hypothetical protein
VLKAAKRRSSFIEANGRKYKATYSPVHDSMVYEDTTDKNNDAHLRHSSEPDERSLRGNLRFNPELLTALQAHADKVIERHRKRHGLYKSEVLEKGDVVDFASKEEEHEKRHKIAEAVERINQHITKEKSFGVDQPEPRKTVMNPLSGKERAPVGQKTVMSPFSKSEDLFSSPETAKVDARLARFKAHRSMKKPVLEEEGTDLDFSDQRPEMPKIPEKKPVVKEPVKKSMDVPTADAVNAPVAPAAPSVPTAEPMMKEDPQTPGQPAKKPKWKALHQGTWHNVLDTYNPDSNKPVHQGGGNVYVLEGKGVVPAHEIDDLEIKG